MEKTKKMCKKCKEYGFAALSSFVKTTVETTLRQRKKMAPLKSLERDYPIIDSNFQHFCASHAIFSVEDILLHDLYMLVALMEQHSNSEKLKQGMTQILSIIDGMHQPWLNGMELLDDSQRNKHILSTGCERIDALLQGGLHEGHLTELVGPSSSGKTQLCLLVASSVAKSYLGSVVYFDTGNSFSPKRIAQIISQISDPTNEEINKVVERVMKNIVCHSVFDIFTLLDSLNQLKSNLKSQINCEVRLLIVDSISSLITPVLGGSGTQGHALMVSAGFLMKELAHEHNLAVLVTNHMVGGEGGNLKPALGESWKSVPHVQLRLSRDQNSNICNIFIFRHPFMASGQEVKFMIL